MGYFCDVCSSPFMTLFAKLEHNNLHTGETPFLCRNCGEAFSLLQHYVDHVKQYNDNHYYPCEKCGSIFRRSSLLRNHVCNIEPLQGNFSTDFQRNQIDTTVNEVDRSTDTVSRLELSNDKSCGKCLVCQKEFTSVKSLNDHKKRFPGAHYRCDTCSKCFSSRKKLESHLSCPKAISPIICSCNETFPSSELFRIHIGNGPITCCQCKMSFSNITNLMKHVRTHTQQKPFICKYCSRAFTQSANLKNHMSIHMFDNGIKCELCSFSCKTPAGLFKHRKKHKEGKEIGDLRKISVVMYTCQTCNKQFKFKRNLAMHEKAHYPGENQCTECGKIFKSEQNLNTHISSSHTSCVCFTCGKVFASSSLLNSHSKIHVRDKDYTCTVCMKRFAIRGYLHQHMKTHSSEKKYSCEVCCKAFKVVSSLKYHRRFSCQRTPYEETSLKPGLHYESTALY